MPLDSESFRPTGLAGVFRSLRYRNYRLFFIGQIISLTGTWVQRTALMWLVYRLTDSPFMVGLVSFTQFVPIFLVGPFAGVLADRLNRQKVLVATQTLALVQAGLLALVVLTGQASMGLILALCGFFGLTHAFDIPARQSLFIRMIGDPVDLSNAIALNSAMFNGARLIGPAVAGLAIAWLGEGICFLLNALSYLAVIAALLAMRLDFTQEKDPRTGILKGIKEGLVYAFSSETIRSILLLLTVVSLLGIYVVLLPVLAREVLQGGPKTYGWLLSSAGAGALAGALCLAWRQGTKGLGRVIQVTATIFSLGLISLSLVRSFWLCAIILAIVGFGLMVQIASSNTLIQTVVDDKKRGRVMSLYSISLMGMVPFGSLISGTLASHLGLENTLRLCGACCLLGSIFFGRKLARLGVDTTARSK